MKIALFIGMWALVVMSFGQANTGRRATPELSVQGFKEIKSLTEKGDAVAQDKLGEAYGSGNGTTEDEAESFRWYKKAAEQGNADAEFHLHFQKQERMQNVEDDLSPFANSRALARVETHGIAAVVSRVLDHRPHLGCAAYCQPPFKRSVGAGAPRYTE